MELWGCRSAFFFLVVQGLDTPIFCPAEVDMHGQPNRLRRTREGTRDPLHTSGVTQSHRVCVCVCVYVCRASNVLHREVRSGFSVDKGPSDAISSARSVASGCAKSCEMTSSANLHK